MNLKGQWVWVTGASSGLGLELSKQLAKQGANVILTARRLERLEALAKEISAAHQVEARALAGDMSKSADVERLINEVKKTPVAAVVLNAGATHFGHHHELEWSAFEAMLQTNVMGTTRITSELIRHYKTTGGSLRIVIVSSMTGLIPVPFQSAYSGTKAFLIAFGTALAHELKGSPISVTVFAPGGIATEMTSGEKFESLRGWLAPVESVAAEAIAALKARPPLWVQGFTNRLGLFVARLVPRNLFMGQLARTYRKALSDAAAKKS
ncbi:MAG: SDR family NAD(P)-dependent oxidoreductase [Archangium sp.]